MNLLFAVIDDLYEFAIGAIFGGTAGSGITDTKEGTETDAIELPEPPEMQEKEIQNFKKVGELLPPRIEETISEGKNTVMYVGTAGLPLYVHPTEEFDTILVRMSYGTMVMVLEQRGRWSKVVVGELTGWVLREELVDRAVHVYPDFTIGEENNSEDPNTLRVRAFLDDLFGGGAASLPLQAGEYVMYRIMRKGLTVTWPSTRPRVPGLWHTILKGVAGIHIGITPKTGSVMEYMYTEEIGHLAYVEAVFPDETINISEVNYPENGIYNERVLTREEWRELKPVFIQIL